MGQIPPPAISVLTNACNTYIKWAEIWERFYDTPTFTIDVPGTRQAGGQTWSGDSDFEADRKYVEVQIRELINVCEAVTGKKVPYRMAGRRPGDPARLLASSDRLRSVLGWKPSYTEIAQVVETAWKWHESHPEGYRGLKIHSPPGNQSAVPTISERSIERPNSGK